jgi:hypothetical protein
MERPASTLPLTDPIGRHPTALTHRIRFDLGAQKATSGSRPDICERSASFLPATRLFEETEFRDTVVTVLIDNSRSMRGRPTRPGGAPGAISG